MLKLNKQNLKHILIDLGVYQPTRCLYEMSVELTILDALIAAHGLPRFCKIDREGFELEALRGLSTRIDFMTLEYNGAHLDQPIACLEELTRLGDPRVNFTLVEGFQ